MWVLPLWVWEHWNPSSLFTLLLGHFFHPLLQREEGPDADRELQLPLEDVSYLWQ